MDAGWDVTRDADALAVPVFVGHGRYDYVVPYHLWDSALPTLPSAVFRLFERSGHQPFFEEPNEFVHAVHEWMKACEAGHEVSVTPGREQSGFGEVR